MMDVRGIFKPLESLPAYNTAVQRLQRREAVLVSGAGDPVQNHISAALTEQLGTMGIVITANETKAKEVWEDMKFYFPGQAMFFPAKDPLFYSADVKGLAIEEERIRVFKALLEEPPKVLIFSVEALYDRLAPRDRFVNFILRKRVGDHMPLDEFAERMVRMGFERRDQIEHAGQFSIRGGIVDIFPIDEAMAYRLEMWGDEIDTIKTLDVETQRSVEHIEWICVYPITEVPLSQRDIESGLSRIQRQQKTASTALREQGLEEEAQRLSEITDSFLYRLSQNRYRGLESYIPFFYENPVTILDYVPEDAILFFQEPARIKEKVRVLQDELQHSVQSRLQKGYLLPEQGRMFPDFEEISRGFDGFAKLYLCSLLGGNQNVFPIKELVSVSSRSINVLQGEETLLLDELRGYTAMRYQTLMLTESQTRVKRMASRLMEEGIPAYEHTDWQMPLVKGSVAVARGGLSRGFVYPEAGFAVVSQKELTGSGAAKGRKKRKKYKGKQISSFGELSVGDYVVHENHGVGIYHGIVQMDDEDSKRDYFKIVYKDGGTLYVPTTSLDMLQKYVAGEDAKPKLNKLGGAEWSKTKNKVREGVAKLAQDLVALYAAREAKKGYAFSPDTVWQKEFEELFPYEETDDQLAAIEDTKKDMESTKIMDRLICGDVGYGKTEIAIRAAFKAVQDGKQVAFLAPTTILAQQHYKTFISRMRDYPIRIELLSRFRTKKEIDTALRETKKGAVDILIGTHRILSQDVAFKDLGLLVVDEEQRFGVAHKEKMKGLKEDVDVLTLTATPSPRTLHMSLTGIRDMSVLEEPPQQRQPIQTFVMEEEEELIREAIYRELGRGGQVFFLHNRVRNIDQVAAMVSRLVPEARVAFAHGQMSERELEDVMFRFVEGEVDVLVCTTIIETGLDISNVNTILIQNADAMGLAQLYQLRGRVGRSNRIAYAYFLYKRGKVLQEVAQKRLEAIGEFTEFGSGFKIAMRDLEIRGAGNILGPEQHGHMGAVGYDLYCKLLEEAMDTARNRPVAQSFETGVYIKVDAFIPSSYIGNESQKLEVYKKIAGIANEEEYYDMQEELTDRYSDMPQSVNNLLEISLIKAMGNQSGIENIEVKQGALLLSFRQDAPLDSAKVAEFMLQYKKTAKIQSNEKGVTMSIQLPPYQKERELLQHVKAALKNVAALRGDDPQGEGQ